MIKPLIALNTDYFPQEDMPAHPLAPEHRVNLGYCPSAYSASNLRYAKAIADAGGVPVLLPHHPDDTQWLLKKVDGFLFTGGLIDLPPHTFGEPDNDPTVYVDHMRTAYDLSLGDYVKKSQKPVLGICAGLQLMNVLRGGSLISHIPNAFPDEIGHFEPYGKDQEIHSVKIKKGSHLARIVGSTHMMVNSAHHMAVKEAGDNLIACAKSDDGVIEAIEDPNHPFYLGVQWHPEFLAGAHQDLFKALINAC